jgi:hypothetical protein
MQCGRISAEMLLRTCLTLVQLAGQGRNDLFTDNIDDMLVLRHVDCPWWILDAVKVETRCVTIIIYLSRCKKKEEEDSPTSFGGIQKPNDVISELAFLSSMFDAQKEKVPQYVSAAVTAVPGTVPVWSRESESAENEGSISGRSMSVRSVENII